MNRFHSLSSDLRRHDDINKLQTYQIAANSRKIIEEAKGVDTGGIKCLRLFECGKFFAIFIKQLCMIMLDGALMAISETITLVMFESLKILGCVVVTVSFFKVFVFPS